jgi:cystatin-C
MEVWKYRVLGSVAALLLLLAIVLPFTQTETQTEEAGMADGALVGGIKDSPAGQDNDLHVVDLARYAVNEHNNKAVSTLEPLLLPSL